MIVKHQNKISVIDTVSVNAKQRWKTYAPRLEDKVNWFFTTQAGSFTHNNQN